MRTRKYVFRDGETSYTYHVSAGTLEAARKKAHEWARERSEEVRQTTWVDTYICDSNGVDIEKVTTQVDPSKEKKK